MTSPSHFLVVCEDVSSLPLHCSLSAELSGTLSWPIAIRRFLRESPQTKKSVFFFSLETMVLSAKTKEFGFCSGKNVTYKQIALENLCLTLSAWVRHRESPTPPLLSSWRPHPFSSSECCLWLPKGQHLLSSPLPLLLLRAQVFASALALPGMFFPFLSAGP